MDTILNTEWTPHLGKKIDIFVVGNSTWLQTPHIKPSHTEPRRQTEQLPKALLKHQYVKNDTRNKQKLI